MKTSKEILTWLKANLGPRATAPLSSHDHNALCASVALTPLISHSGANPKLFAGYQAIVLEMQEHTRHLAYHAIAMELDWSHRNMIWTAAEHHTSQPFYAAGLGLRPNNKCCFESGGGGQERSDLLKKQR